MLQKGLGIKKTQGFVSVNKKEAVSKRETATLQFANVSNYFLTISVITKAVISFLSSAVQTTKPAELSITES